MIRVKCPQCERTLGVDDAKAGKSVKCPECQNSIKVPAAAAAKTTATKEKPSKGKRVRPGEEPDDFDPYSVEEHLPPKIQGETELVDDLVKHADKQRKRQKAWNKVGPAARMMKVLSLVSCIVFIVAFLYMFMTVVLYAHQKRLATQDSSFSGKGNMAPTPLWPLGEFLPSKSHGGLENEWYVALIFFGIMVFGLGWFGTIIAGAEKMKKLESYGFAMTAAILETIAMPPVGVMALFSLRDEQVIEEFEETARQQKKSRQTHGD
jgi:DNA-directed RNA polymerase subunit M/transcription elongation factor TFIIS